MDLKELETKAERQLQDIEQERDLFDTRNYISSMRNRIGELEVVEIEYQILKRRIHALVQQLINGELALGHNRPFAPKLVETRGNRITESVSPGGQNLPLSTVEHLDNPLPVANSSRAEVDVDV